MRHGIRVRGTVQGVGFRPAVYRLASELAVAGFVRNDSEGVWIEAEADADALASFERRLREHAPPLARVDHIEVIELRAVGDHAFRVVGSSSPTPARTIVPADAATCAACLRELFDPRDRRHRYPFINCTDCGPRYSIVRDVPYDRARTTMAAFAMCAACRAEYDDPRDRRFHAEPNACPECGPRLALWRDGPTLEGEAALAGAVELLAAGRIVAVKGLGGFHLAVDAAAEDAVVRLRARKRRPDRPLALMVRSVDDAAALVELDEAARAALCAPARPIVLAPRRAGARVAPAVAPRLAELGVILAYTPLHHLLLAAGPPALVMTSGNRAEEPIARDDADARARLAAIADAVLGHDRAIHMRADDTVLRAMGGAVQPVRRSRGVAPEALSLLAGDDTPPICAVGAELKNTVCLTRGDDAYLSPHVGDLENAETHAFFVECIERLARLLDVTPAIVAHDLHPDYLSTRWALDAATPREPVQHHHAHIAACLVDNGRAAPAIGVAFDGTGCGPAGDLWGGEILACDLVRAERLAHLRPIALPGGAAAIHEPWRVAVAALLDAELPLSRLGRIPPLRLAAVAALVERAQRATGCGRWFDAVAALCGVRDVVTYEGQAAVELEALAAPADVRPYPFGIDERAGAPDVYDLRPAIRALCAELDHGAPAALAAARFHHTLAAIVVAAARRARQDRGLELVALSGGCFQNRLLTTLARQRLHAAGFEVITHRRVPPNDGGVALGQAAIAAHRWRARRKDGTHVSRHPR